MGRSIFGWSLPPGCGTLPGEESQPPCCEECPEEKFKVCPGQDNCQEVYLISHPACCLNHKVEMIDSECGECQADFWAVCDLDLTAAKDRVRLLRAGFTKEYPKRIEKLYLEALGIRIKVVKTKELFAFAGETYHLPISIKEVKKYVTTA
ncbi:MAG: hypothetical protein Q8K36_06965 [Alphaproteobacteria bacterium]|nr:hypothetical protein [Alphaproteobacteria bacterium]